MLCRQLGCPLFVCRCSSFCSSVSSLNQFLFTPDRLLDLEESACLCTAAKLLAHTKKQGHSSIPSVALKERKWMNKESNYIYSVCEGRAVQSGVRGAEGGGSELPLTPLSVKNFRQEAPHSSYHNYTDTEERQRGNFFDILEARKLLLSHVDRENTRVKREFRGVENESLFEPCLTNTGAPSGAKVHLACAKIHRS